MIVSFTDSGHAGDKRKRSQACDLSQSVIHMLGALSMVVSMFFLINYSPGCLATSGVHESACFTRSKAALWSLGPVSRARVLELWGDDVDRPVSSAGRAPCLQPTKLRRVVVVSHNRAGCVI